jgi:hypothetical protein
VISKLRIDIVRFVDERFPGFVECLFTDADGKDHALVDKALMFTEKDLWIDSQYPESGHLRCQILSRSKNVAGEELVRITIARPDGLETVNGLTEFEVLAEHVSSDVVAARS